MDHVMDETAHEKKIFEKTDDNITYIFDLF